ncbi:glutathione S-transferase family protein [Roseococcus thiosulfatophilus]|uniref:glutathione S-transferase family protein n=1 Tax=Roseococcus thiosulfatophilus TaxID=35813 RepID=UPI001A8D3903|nr:glutathione S-transferase family protein [Roseococcus thiosulfatophilus]
MARQLYELCGTDPARVFSPFCWRSRFALAHKGLDFESIPWRFTETERLAFAKHDKVPVLVDGERVVPDSFAIARHLDEAYPELPSLMHGRAHAYRFIQSWTGTVFHAALIRLIVSDVPPLLDEPARSYFIASREKRFGMKLAEVTRDREARLPEFRAMLAPLRDTVTAQPYLGGDAPDYADHVVMGAFMWARGASPLRLLTEDDPVWSWRERMLDAYGGLARATPSAEA